ncbi:diguanylate cyclase [Campylobacter sputorum subsp. bubulus]|uniref:Diguanylate cyclase n=1 Tax=Campylobacter sputorum subsp. sputorum TaxID=32024 RepID=A0A381DJR4_9BACT|nr:acetyltransferase [Campylobacter sputorum]ASM35754.1 sugar O-acyltransferase, sialic acid O-acetyltransferase NeuD family [Campylobacter sputorum aubsp. sputorum RM3237]KAB0581458.1 acetyltransferase [Campylobacter sputorum subsp. sputorum]QEL05944.1 sugar O-acyltransferase [Campylobacter sputorum subsp. sputorum]SUX09041.1 diguanylate cyclase [Campylobacter sputorum subsp. bubulus]SUX10731.1 diguanylate cyclase [Campylobacter sputorum subsp. sputorum]
MDKIILIGGGGHCRSVIDVVESEKRFEIFGIIDIDEKVGQNLFGYEIIGTQSDLTKIFKHCKNAIISLGQIKTSASRKRIYEQLKAIGFNLPSIISPFAYVSKYAKIGEGSVVMHNALINSSAIVGKNCIINTKALIEHDAIIGDFSHISTASVVNGGVVIGDDSFFGSNAVAKEYVKIGKGCIIGAGVSVLNDIGDGLVLKNSINFDYQRR